MLGITKSSGRMENALVNSLFSDGVLWAKLNCKLFLVPFTEYHIWSDLAHLNAMK